MDATGVVSADSIARDTWREYRAQRRARRDLELIWELLLLYIDGAGDGQWATIMEGDRVEIPRTLSEYRKTENVLRPIVRNAVAYHTTILLNYFADSSGDRASREKALIDSIWVNNLQRTQDWNGLFAQAMSLAMAAGFCTVHGYWREDPDAWSEPIAPEGQPQGAQPGIPTRGMIDCFVGNPWDTVFDSAARRGSYRSMRYMRLLPAQVVRDHFGQFVPAARDLEGSLRIPSTAEFQRIARNWFQGTLGIHGRPVIQASHGHHGGKDELIALLFDERAPTGPNDPGHLRILAVPGFVDLAGGRDDGHSPVLLADQPLPGGDFSGEVFYSDERGSDVHGKPWAESLAQMQVDLNLTLSYEWEHLRKQAEAPIVGPGGAFHDDMMELGGYNFIEVEPSLANWRPRVMEWPQTILTSLQSKQARIRQQMFTLGGYQAVSRGEAPGTRTPYRAILALQQADKTIHGPVNLWYQRSAAGFARRMWKQMKAYGDVPWLMDIVGPEYGYLVDPYIDKTRLSDEPPRFTLVNAFGASPELLAQEVLQLASFKGADGQPIMSTEEARQKYPYRMFFDAPGDPKAVQRRRARTVATYAHTLATRYRELTGFDEAKLPPEWRHQAVAQVGQQLAFYGIVVPDGSPQGHLVQEGLEQKFERLQDDDLNAHLMAYTEVTQDETADPIARAMLRARQSQYLAWQAQQAAQQQAAQQQTMEDAVQPVKRIATVAAPAAQPPAPQQQTQALPQQADSPAPGVRQELAAGHANVTQAQAQPPQAAAVAQAGA